MENTKKFVIPKIIAKPIRVKFYTKSGEVIFFKALKTTVKKPLLVTYNNK